MGFLDKAKAAANELAAKADTALANSGMAAPGGQSTERLLRDLGVLTWLELNGGPQPEGERDRILSALRDAEQRGALGPLTLRSAAPPPASVPPPPGAAGAPQNPPPPPGAGAATPPADGPSASAAASTRDEPAQPAPAPPPPPSWAERDES